MLSFSIFTSNTVGDSSNCIYPHEIQVTDKSSFKKAIQFDHVCGEYKSHYRSNDNFMWSDVIPMDCDNDHSDNPEDWVYPLEVAMAFTNCCFAISYSRNHMKEKNGKAARPKFHVYFPIPRMTDGAAYAELKKVIQQFFPYFDSGALGESRFLYGTSNPTVEFYEGPWYVTEFAEKASLESFETRLNEIKAGSRNSTMSHFAGKLIKRFGSTNESYQMFLDEAEKCQPPLDDSELNKIWYSACKFGRKVQKQSDYIPPEKFNQELTLKPNDYSDVGQAEVLAREYYDKIRYSPSTEYLVYNDSFWEESKQLAQGLVQELTTRQLEEAQTEIEKCMKELIANGAFQLIVGLGVKKAKEQFTKEQKRSFDKYESALSYEKFVLKRRDSKYIWAALKEVCPYITIQPQDLDVNEFLLNTPDVTVHLKTGKTQEHQATDFITKQTSVVPSDNGMDIWQAALNTFFVNDSDLIDYVQQIVGLASVGKVFVEALIIAYGEGSNGKSTFWNVIARVLGTYSGNISADMLTVGCRRNVKPELAEAKGKRLLIAAELEEGMRMNTSNVKQLCSTDEIFAEKKFKSPFSYTPTHTLVLYTNHLPKVGAIDKGTWRRLIVVPFNAKIKGNKDIKNYADYLFEHAGGAILKWIIEGAKKVIQADFKLIAPTVVSEAIEKYKEDNDWLGQFLEECCEIDASFTQKSGEFYNEYRALCARTGAYTRSTSDFYNAVESEGFVRKKTKKGIVIQGVRILSDFE